MSDLRPLLWLRWRQLSRAGLYWLAVVGYDPGAGALMDRIYGFYVLAAVGAIAVVGWAGAVNAAQQMGRALAGTPAAASALSSLVPGLVLGIQTLLLAVAMASSPLKLTSPDVAHVAGAPLRRGAVVAVAFLRGLPPRLLVPAAIGDLASIVLGGSLHYQAAGAVTAAALAVFSTALAWLLGMLRLAGAARRRRRLWLVPVLAVPLLAWGLPGFALWPGRALAAALAGQAPVWNPTLLLAAAALSAGMVALGSRANMAVITVESGPLPQMAALGALAWTDPAAVRQIRLDAAQAGRRARLALPDARGAALLPARAALAYVRRLGLLLPLLRDLTLTVFGCWVLLGHGAGLPWFDWVFASAAIPPRGVGDIFDADTHEPFLRQFLPVDDLTLLLGDAGLPALLVLLLSVAAWIVRRPLSASLWSGIACAALLVALRALCQAVAPARPREGAWHPPFIAAAGVCFGLMAVAAVPAHAPGFALELGAAMVAVLALVTARA